MNNDEAPLCITLTEAQENELRFRLKHVTRTVPPSFWETAARTRGEA